jgi:hypothetical protein
VLDSRIQIALMTQHDHLCEDKFIDIALSLRRAGRHPGLPTKFICRNTRVHRKNIAPNKESNSNARQDLELTASLSSSRKPSRHLSYTRKIALSNSMLVSLRQSYKRAESLRNYMVYYQSLMIDQEWSPGLIRCQRQLNS